MSNTMTKEEALRQLSVQLRRDGLDDLMFCKLLTVYIKLSGWDKTPTPSPKTPPVKTPSALELVLEAERKRRAEG